MMIISPLLALACISCDQSPSASTPHDREYMSSRFDCTVDVRAGSLACTESNPARGDVGPALLGQNQIKMASSNLVADTITQITSFDATVQNLLTHAIGTPDGQARTGLKVFFESGPTAAAFNAPYDTGTVNVRNPDGVQSFSKARQPYFFYDTILQPQQITRAKRWELTVPRSVARFSFSVRVFSFTPPETKVPDSAPQGFLIPADSVAKLYALSNSVLSHPRMSGPYPRNIVELYFHPSATLEDRQSAVDMVNGRVIGGGGGGGFYYVLVPTTTGDALWAVIDSLSALPHVRLASPDILTQGMIPAYLRPNDGPGWGRGDWALSADSAGGSNWAPEAIGAPFGWGCEIGNDSARVAVIDTDPQHAQWVGNIISNRTNDSTEIAGLMWHGRVTTTSAGISGALEQAFRDSVHVINLSVSVGFIDSLATASAPPGVLVYRLPQPGLPADVQRAAGIAAQYAARLQQLETQYRVQPLYVIAAGNYQMDASFSGLPQLRSVTGLGSRVLVVAGAARGTALNITSRQRPMWANSGVPLNPGSNFGGLVDLAAPGDTVQTYANGIAATVSGTSFAAPHVAGAAGLLKSFDPRLTVAQIRDLLLDGARRGGWTTVAPGSTLPFLNVYESLQLVARRTGAPICGQRFWIQNGSFKVQRDPGSAAADSLFHLDFNPLGLNVLHGGKQVNVRRPNVGPVTYRWSAAAGWHLSTPDAQSEPVGSNATWRSRAPKSHDGDTILRLSRDYGAATTIFRLELWDKNGLRKQLPPITVPRVPGTPQCTQEYVSVHPASHDSIMSTGDTSKIRIYNDWLAEMNQDPCFRWAEGTSFTTPNWDASYSPRGEAVYLFAETATGGAVVRPWRSCGAKGRFSLKSGEGFDARVYMRCRDWTTNDESAGTQVYRVDVNTGVGTLLSWNSPTAHFRAVGFRENLRELALEAQTWTRTANTIWVQGADEFTWGVGGTTTRDDQCTVQFRNASTGAVLFNSPGPCRSEGGDAGFSSSRAAP